MIFIIIHCINLTDYNSGTWLPNVECELIFHNLQVLHIYDVWCGSRHGFLGPWNSGRDIMHHGWSGLGVNKSFGMTQEFGKSHRNSKKKWVTKLFREYFWKRKGAIGPLHKMWLNGVVIQKFGPIGLTHVDPPYYNKLVICKGNLMSNFQSKLSVGFFSLRSSKQWKSNGQIMCRSKDTLFWPFGSHLRFSAKQVFEILWLVHDVFIVFQSESNNCKGSFKLVHMLNKTEVWFHSLLQHYFTWKL